MSAVDILIVIIILAGVLAIIWYVPIPQTYKNILMIVACILFAIYLLQMLPGTTVDID